MIRFVGNDAEGLPLKRKQSQRACERCRKRKKRCLHYTAAQSNDPDSHHTSQHSNIWLRERDRMVLERSNAEDHSGRSQVHQLGDSASRPSMSQLNSPIPVVSNKSTNARAQNAEVYDDDEDRDPRFVGELNPESTIIAGASPAVVAAQSNKNSPEDVVGIWVPRKLVNAAKTTPGPILPELLPYLEDQCSRALPQPAAYDTIYRIYVQHVHPILPIVNLEAYHNMPGKAKTMIKLAICLIVCSNSAAHAYLGRPPKEFSSQVTQLLRSAIDNGLIRDKQVIIQVFIILALSTQLSDERHASAEFASRAISYIHTFGLHLENASRSDNPYVTRLFCCALAVDRLNAAIQGRPVLMHERDTGRDVSACVKQQDGLFQLLLRVILLLDQVIALYRPSSSTKASDAANSRTFDLEFPAFEDLLGECGTMKVPAALVATVETLYHAVAMLSCRSQSLSEMSRSSVSHARQSLSAANIMSIASNEFRGQLSILPFVPYALSLALRVSYRDLRLSKSSFTRVRARRQLLEVCTLLRELGGIFSSSLHMADLAEQIVHEMDRAYSAVASQRHGSLTAVVPEVEPQHVQKEQVHKDTVRSDHRAQTSALSSPVNGSNIVLPHNGTAGAPAEFDFDFDFDIFDHFDPEFDIEAIDAALATSIDPALPGDVADWNPFNS